METSNSTVADILNDLVAINNDRVSGYEHALKELTDGDQDLKPLFVSMIDESREAKMELGEEVQVLKGNIASGDTAGGSIYSAWLAIKAVFTGHNRHVILENCEAVEDATQKAYESALENEHLPAYLREMIFVQKEMLRASHNEIRAFRDQEVDA